MPVVNLRCLPSATVIRTGTSSFISTGSSSGSTLANSNSSRPYSFRWLSRSSRRVNRSPVLNVSCRRITFSLTLAYPRMSISPNFASTPGTASSVSRRRLGPTSSSCSVTSAYGYPSSRSTLSARSRDAARKLAIERTAGLERQRLAQRLLAVGRDHVEPADLDGLDAYRLSFADVEGDVDLVLRVVQFDVE